jgi:hypothetical protein
LWLLLLPPDLPDGHELAADDVMPIVVRPMRIL